MTLHNFSLYLIDWLRMNPFHEIVFFIDLIIDGLICSQVLVCNLSIVKGIDCFEIKVTLYIYIFIGHLLLLKH